MRGIFIKARTAQCLSEIISILTALRRVGDAPDHLDHGLEIGKGDMPLLFRVVELECKMQQFRRVCLPLHPPVTQDINI